MSTLKVELAHHTYPIVIRPNLLKTPTVWLDYVAYSHIVIITNHTVAAHYLQLLKHALPTHARVLPIVLADGEDQKNLTTIDNITTTLITHHVRRNALVIALGGGVIGDIAGLVAALYQRGVDFIQMPTSLLAMVDASVGGKTAVNHALGKNMLGAFYQPKAVLIDVSLLNTLSEREFAAGMAEVIKYGLLADEPFYRWLMAHHQAIQDHDPETLHAMIKRCCEIKAQIVSQDEYDHGQRVFLNLGHTFAHAIEHLMGYGVLVHGEAVAIGLVMALRLSVKLYGIAANEIDQLIGLLQAFDLPTHLPAAINPHDLLSIMRRDKKNHNDGLRLVLLLKIGCAQVNEDVADDVVLSVL